MQPGPGAALEVIESEFLLHLLVRLLTRPASLERRRDGFERGVGRVVGQVILRLAVRSTLADEPRLVAGTVPMTDDGLAVGDADAECAELRAQHALGATTPRNRPERVRSERRDDVAYAARLGGCRAARAWPARHAFGSDGSQFRRHRVHPVAAIREHVAERHAGRYDTRDLVERDLPLRTKHDLFGYAALATTRRVLGPRLGQVQPPRHRKRHLVTCQRQRHERLAVGVLAELSAVLMRDAYRMRALLHERRVVDDQVRVASPDQRVGLVEQNSLVVARVPCRRRDEVMKLLL